MTFKENFYDYYLYKFFVLNPFKNHSEKTNTIKDSGFVFLIWLFVLFYTTSRYKHFIGLFTILIEPVILLDNTEDEEGYYTQKRKKE